MRRLIIDTDTGSDDVWAIIAALRATEEVKVEMISIVCGNVSLDLCVKNALIATEVADTYYPPVYAGMGRPMIREKLFTADYVHGSDGLGEMHLPDPAHRPADGHAIDAIIDTVMSNPGEIEIITLGPLSNIAMAYLKEPAIAKNVKKLWIMGGTGMDQGNATPAAEFNVYVDPEAASVVLKAGFDAIWVTWDVARSGTEINPEDVKRMLSTNSKAANFCYRCTQSLRAYDQKKFGHDSFGIIDSVIMMAFLYPEIMRDVYDAYCEIELNRGVAYGYFAIDKHHQTKQESNATICSVVDAKAYKEHLFKLLDE